jgi:ABC-type Fe3+-hydroxamate transport system substrate-binding protein
MINLKDHLGDDLKLKNPAQRIVSLVPSISRLLMDLNLDKSIVGITRFCDESKHHKIKKIGGTKNPNITRIKELKPDLILANKEENNKEDLDQLREYCNCYVCDVVDIVSNNQMISDIGKLTSTTSACEKIITEINLGFSKLSRLDNASAAYLIWDDPLMTAGGDTFIHHILEQSGFANIYESSKRYPTITDQEINDLKPEFLLLSSEPYPFGKKHIELFENRFPGIKIVLVDGKDFSWYGSHMIKAAKSLEKLILSLK